MSHPPTPQGRPLGRLLVSALGLAGLAISCALPANEGTREGTTGLLVLEEGGPTLTLLGTSEVRQRVTVADGNASLVISPTGAIGALSVPEEGRVQLLDVERMRRGADIELGLNSQPSALAFIDEERLLIGSSRISLPAPHWKKSSKILPKEEKISSAFCETGAESTTELFLLPAEQTAWLLDSEAGRVTRLSWTRPELRRSEELGEGLTSLAKRPGSKELWVLSNTSDRIIVLEIDSLELLGEIPCAGGPSALAFDQHDDAWVACSESDEVVRFNAETGELLARISVPSSSEGIPARPVDILLEPESDRAWVACHGSGSLQIIDQVIERCVAEVDGLLQPARMKLAPHQGR